MKHFISLLILIASMVLFTGCGIKVGYDNKHIKPDIKQNINKVENINIEIEEKSKSVLVIRPTSTRGKMVDFTIHTKTVNQKILNDFINQYFNINQQSDLKIKLVSKISDVSVRLHSIRDVVYYTITLNIELYDDKNNIIMQKTYKEEVGNLNDIWRITNIMLPSEESFNRGLFSMYEEIIKPDLVEALKKHYKQ